MPALENERKDAPIDNLLFERIRESGHGAVKVANWIPGILQQSNLTTEDLQNLVASVEKCRMQSAHMVRDAEKADNSQIMDLARQVEALWSMISEKVAARIQL